ncbi:MAG: RHS repeat protein [Gammaproteobacteria bacterium]|nr:RHS repeat protein [Gammaproteobacteria bacterium]MCF6362017.1 RHS repeat protein [Gammaproteobacteria bacterium]
MKRQIASSNSTGIHITTYAYNDLGQVSRVTSPEVTYTYAYNATNRLKTITNSEPVNFLFETPLFTRLLPNYLDDEK